MKKLNFYKYSSLSLLILNIVLIGFLFFRPAPGPKKMIIHELGFTKDQVNQYESLIQSHRANVEALEKWLFDAKKALYEQLGNGAALGDTGQILDDMASLHRQLEMAHYEHFEDIRRICTEEQIPRFKELMNKLPRLFLPPPRGPRPGSKH